MKVITFNAYKGEYKENLVKVIKNEAPDIILLQETTKKLMTYLSEELSDYKQYVRKDSGRFRNAILSLHNSDILRFIAMGEGDRDSIQIEHAGIQFVCVHFSSGIDKADIRSVEINQLISEIEDKPTVIAGDFNMRIKESCDLKEDKWIEYKDAFTYCSTNKLTTYKGNWKHPFDRILYKNVIITDINMIGVEEVCSDHYGLSFIVTAKNNDRCNVM